MNEKNVVICDPEMYYADSLATNIYERKELAVKVYTCGDLGKAVSLSERIPVHLLVVDEYYLEKARDAVKAEGIVVLSRGNIKEELKVGCVVYKYQSADRIIRAIFEAYEPVLRTLPGEQARLIGVYSPIHRVAKTTFSIELGKAYARKENTLYLNMEEYAGFLRGEEGENLGDFLYHVKQGNKNWSMSLKTAAKQIEKLDYIPPICMAPDLKEVTEEEWCQFFAQIRAGGQYQIIILDLGESIQGLFSILEQCDCIYMPVLDDERSCEKIKQFEENIEKLELHHLKNRMRQFVMPQDIAGYAKQQAKEAW